MGKLRNTVIILFLLLLIALAAIIYVVPSVTGMLVETYPAEYGELEIYDDAVGYFFRNEIVYAAKDGGDVNRLAQEGDLLRPYTTVIEITALDSEGGTYQGAETSEGSVDKASEIRKKIAGSMKTVSSFQVENGGIVSFYVDGNEYAMTPDKIDSIKRDQLESVRQSQTIQTENPVRSGYPVFKIVSNNGWQLLTYVPKDHMDQYEEGETVNVTFFERDENNDKVFPDLSEKDPLYNKVEMIVKSVSSEGDYGRIVLRSTRFFGGIGQYRVANCRIVSHDVTGLLLESGSITEVDGVTGVYVKNKKGKYDFIPVRIYGSDGKTTVVADNYFYDSEGNYTRTIDPFDDILRKPREEKEE